MFCFAKEGEQIQKGDTVGKYLIVRQLGYGGEGCVYLGLHRQTQQLWALKEVPISYGREAYREIYALRRLHHRALPAVADVLETDTAVILIMEYIRGKDLRCILSERHCLNYEQLLDFAVQISSALEYLHSRNPPVLHLDLKPANIICCEGDRLVLVDFGAALYGGEDIYLTCGTDGYAAPELYLPGQRPDERADVYAFGATMYELCCGQKYILSQHGRHMNGCPDALAAVIRHCLEEDPAERYKDAGELRTAVRMACRKERSEKQRIQLWLAVILTIFSISLAAKSLHTINIVIQQGGAALTQSADGSTAGEMTETVTERAAENVTENVTEQAIGIVWGALTEETSETMQEEQPVEPQEEKQGEVETEAETEIAADADMPFAGDAAAWMHLLEDAAEDGVLTKEEDIAFRCRMYEIPVGRDETCQELLSRDPISYGQICFSLGCLYYFLYQQSDAKRIAAEWFARAVDTAGKQGEQTDWLEMALIYEQICSDTSFLTQDSLEQAQADQLGISVSLADDLDGEIDRRLTMLNQIMGEGLYQKAGSALRLRQWLWLSEELVSCCVHLSTDLQRQQAERFALSIWNGFEEDVQLAELENDSPVIGQMEENMQSVYLLLDSTKDLEQDSNDAY